MKTLSDILYKVRIKQVEGSTDRNIKLLSLDSREQLGDGLFAALRGTQVDGHKFIESAIENGATAVLCEFLPEKLHADVTYVQVMDTAEALGVVSANFYGNPTEELKIIAITGTNGKTTTATLLHRLFDSMGVKAGLLSTVVNLIGNEPLTATHTTPDAIALHKLFRQMVDEGCEYCFMEASSHAIHQKRVHGVSFAAGVFTNITHDHLDYHRTFAEYIKAKKQLFDELPASAFALVNRDSNQGDVMVQNTRAKVRTYALRSMGDYKGKIIESHFEGLYLNIDGNELYSKLIGGFNAYNILACYGVAVELGFDKIDVLTHLSKLDAVEGRFQYLKRGSVTAVVDYAHTPDALANVLKTIKSIRTGNEQVITVVGCGGDRDRDKRPEMARISAHLSDKVILTSDNPRSEEPEAIIEDMSAGLDPVQVRKVLRITDRKEAIRTACSLAGSGDIILIAGKGHEKYQEIKGEKFPFDDVQIVDETLKTLES